MRSSRIVVEMLVVALVLHLAAAPAYGAPTPEEKATAREHYQKGLTHYELREYAEALAQFKNAYRFVQDPAFLFNIAQCHRRLGQDAEALDFYRNFLRRSPNAPNRAEVERRVQEIEKELAGRAAHSPAAPPPSSSSTTPPARTKDAPPSDTRAKAPASTGPPATVSVAKTAPVPGPDSTPSSATAPAAILTTGPDAGAGTDRGEAPPVYKRWWFWTGVGAAVAGAVIVGVALSTRGEAGTCLDVPASQCRLLGGP